MTNAVPEIQSDPEVGLTSELTANSSGLTANKSKLVGNRPELSKPAVNTSNISELAGIDKLTASTELPSTSRLVPTFMCAPTSKLVHTKAVHNLTDVDSVLTSNLIQVNVPKRTSVPAKIIQVKEIPEEIMNSVKIGSLTVDEDCEMNELARTSASIDISTKAKTEQQLEGSSSSLPLHTIPVTNFNCQQRAYEWLISFANGVAKRGMFSFGVILIISGLIGFKTDDQSLYLSIGRLSRLLPLLWIRHSDEITDYVVKKMTDFNRTYFNSKIGKILI